MMKYLKQFKKIDWPLFIAVVILVFFGLSVLYSVGLNQGIDSYNLFTKQAVFSIIGLFLVVMFSFFNYSLLKNLSFFVYLISVILLVLVLFFGAKIQGTTGWFVVGGFSFQPVELAKFGLILFLSTFFVKIRGEEMDIKTFIISFFIAMTPILLVFKQPDLGSVLVLLFIWLVFIFLSGIKKKYIFLHKNATSK